MHPKQQRRRGKFDFFGNVQLYALLSADNFRCLVTIL